MQRAYPAGEGYRDAYGHLLDKKRPVHSGERYIDLRVKARIAEPCLIADRQIHSCSHVPSIAAIADPLAQWDAWLDYASAFIQAQPDDTLLSNVVLKQ